jgi:hypothetical protein
MRAVEEEKEEGKGGAVMGVVVAGRRRACCCGTASWRCSSIHVYRHSPSSRISSRVPAGSMASEGSLP